MKLELLNFEIDGTFPAHSPNPQNPEACVQLQGAVKAAKADLGIIFDGDADRVMFCDEKGQILRGDLTVAILSRYFLRKNIGASVACDLRSSDYVRDAVEGAGGKLREMPVGHSFVVQGMVKENIKFGGEVSGHLYYEQNGFIADNTWIPTLQLLEELSVSGKKLSELTTGIEKYFTVIEKNFKDIDKDKAIVNVMARFEKEAIQIYELDGLSMRFVDWRFNLRKSNTEPLVRLMIESTAEKVLAEKMAEMTKLIENRD